MGVVSTVNAVNSTPLDLKTLVWLIGTFISTGITGATVAWWFSRQHSSIRKDLYAKIGYVERDVTLKLNTSKDTCTDTKERVGLLEQAHGHLEKRIEGIDNKLDVMQSDVAATRDSLSTLSQKQSEQYLTVVGEIRSQGEKMMLTMLQHSKENK
jgi:septal ring factor EnvC (AmiA/AmiB activator)